MSENDAVKAIAAELVESCYDPQRKVYTGRIIELTGCHTSSGEDLGDWTIIVQPTRIPEGKRVDTSN